MRGTDMAYPKMSALALALLLSGCASFSQDGGLQEVSALTSARVGQSTTLARQADDAQLTQLLSQPLSADSAVQIALLNNRSLKIALAELGASEADLVQAGRLRNPGLSFGRVHGGDGNEIDRSVSFDLAGLLTMPMRVKIEKAASSKPNCKRPAAPCN